MKRAISLLMRSFPHLFDGSGVSQYQPPTVVLRVREVCRVRAYYAIGCWDMVSVTTLPPCVEVEAAYRALLGTRWCGPILSYDRLHDRLIDRLGEYKHAKRFEGLRAARELIRWGLNIRNGVPSDYQLPQ